MIISELHKERWNNEFLQLSYCCLSLDALQFKLWMSREPVCLYVFVAVREGYNEDNLFLFLFLLVTCFAYCDPDYEQGPIVGLMWK